jgi:hypothetical protein
MPTADLAPLGGQKTSQHARAGEGVLQVQPVEPPHDYQIGVRRRPRQVVGRVIQGATAHLLLPMRCECHFKERSPSLMSSYCCKKATALLRYSIVGG